MILSPNNAFSEEIIIIRNKTVHCGNITRCFLSLDLNSISGLTEIEDAYAALYTYMAENNILPVYEKIFGEPGIEEKIVTLRFCVQEEFEVPLPPYTFIEGYTSPFKETMVSTILVYGIVKSDGNRVKYIHDPLNNISGSFVYNGNKLQYYILGTNVCYGGTSCFLTSKIFWIKGI